MGLDDLCSLARSVLAHSHYSIAQNEAPILATVIASPWKKYMLDAIYEFLTTTMHVDAFLNLIFATEYGGVCLAPRLFNT